MDAFCLTSEFEGFGLVALEAMLSGRPLLARPVGFVPDAIVNRVNGIIVDGDAESFCEAARLVADHPRWARALAREGRRYARRHGCANRMCREYADLFETLRRTARHTTKRELIRNY
jgi:glycosyltransferase involved in cell wall biosynthesis